MTDYEKLGYKVLCADVDYTVWVNDQGHEVVEQHSKLTPMIAGNDEDPKEIKDLAFEATREKK